MPSAAARQHGMDAEAAAATYDCRVVDERKEYVDLLSEESGTYYQGKQSERRDQ